MALIGPLGVEVIYRADAATGPVYWANRYEVANSIDNEAQGQTIAVGYAAFARRLLMGNFFVDRVVVSTLAQDGKPYNPDTFVVLPVDARGTRGGTDTPLNSTLPLFNVLLLRKVVTSGRLGHAFIRGMLIEQDIVSDPLSGAVSLANFGAIVTEVAGAFTELRNTLGAGSAMHLISGTGLLSGVREVTGLLPVRVTSRSLRTQRKSRLVAGAVSTLGEVLSDGGVTLDEFPKLFEAGRRIIGYLGGDLPALPG